MYETNALNQQRLPARQADRLDDFTIDIEEGAPGGGRVFFVQGKALQKFTQVGTRWMSSTGGWSCRDGAGPRGSMGSWLFLQRMALWNVCM